MKKSVALLLLAAALPLVACEYRGYYGDGHDWHHGDDYDNSYHRHGDSDRGDRDNDGGYNDRYNYRR